MSPSPTPALSAGAAPLPPLPDLPAQPAAPAKGGFLKAILQGTQPVQDAVTSIQQACKQVVVSGAVPGSEQICAQIIALAQQLVPMAVQQAMGGQGQGALTPPPQGGSPTQGPPPQGGAPPQGQGQ